MTEFDAYFDNLLLQEPKFREYLLASQAPVIGLSIAVGLAGDVPCHPTKIPYVRNLVARDPAHDATTHNLRRNLTEYLKRRGALNPQLFFEGDCPLAHLGSVVMSGLGQDDPSFLSICGTGMATADDEFFIFFAHVKTLLADDPELFPPEQTEKGQIQYCVAGKGLWAVMHRAILLRSREPDAHLDSSMAERWFASPTDSRRVCDLWVSTLPDGKLRPEAQAMRASMPDGSFADLQALSRPIMAKAVSAFVSNTMATLLTMKNCRRDLPCTIFLEGGVALDEYFFRQFETEMISLCQDKPLLDRLDCRVPIKPRILRDVRRAAGDGLADEIVMSQLDITLIGSMALAIAGTAMKTTNRHMETVR